MVPTITLIGIVFSVICSLFVPVAIWIYLVKKDKKMSRRILCGMFGFFIAHIVLRVPLLQLLSSTQWFQSLETENVFIYSLFIALSTALFEIASRFVIFKYALKDDICFMSAVGVGFGHSACETLAYTALTSVVNLSVSIMINTDTLAKTENYELIKESLINESASTFFASGTERLISMVIYIGITIILAYFMKNNKDLAGFGICFGIYAIYNLTVQLVSRSQSSVWVTIAVMCVFAAMTAIAALYLNKKDRSEI